MRFLDGACLLFGPNGTFLEAVAWNHGYSYKTQVYGAVTHSGDIMNEQDRRGLNYAWISLAGLGAGVQQVYITLSAWMESKLVDIQMPYVQVGGSARCTQCATACVLLAGTPGATTTLSEKHAACCNANSCASWAVQV